MYPGRMGRRAARWGILATLTLVAACGLSSIGVAPDAPDVDGGPDGSVVPDTGADVPIIDVDADAALVVVPEDATTLSDASIPDVAVDVVEGGADGGCPVGSFLCDTLCVTTCLGCPTGRLECEPSRTCVGSCSGECSHAFECVTCGEDRVTVNKMRCRTSPSAQCYVGEFEHCQNCKAVGCPGTEQICVHIEGSGLLGDRECRGCGEPNTNGASCAGGGRCRDTQFVCN